ncbi:MAG: hypothetical protein QXH97_00340 [Candidatus Bathyarchaeia archaeon]
MEDRRYMTQVQYFESVATFLARYRSAESPIERAELLREKIINLLRECRVRKIGDTRETKPFKVFMIEYEKLMKVLARRRMNISGTCYHFAELITDDDYLIHNAAYLILIYAPDWEVQDVRVWPLIENEIPSMEALKVLIHFIVRHMPFTTPEHVIPAI